MLPYLVLNGPNGHLLAKGWYRINVLKRPVTMQVRQCLRLLYMRIMLFNLLIFHRNRHLFKCWSTGIIYKLMWKEFIIYRYFFTYYFFGVLYQFVLSRYDTSKQWVGEMSSATMQNCSFPVVGPTTWNGLLIDLRHVPNGACSQFHYILKTVLFRLAWVGSDSK